MIRNSIKKEIVNQINNEKNIFLLYKSDFYENLYEKLKQYFLLLIL